MSALKRTRLRVSLEAAPDTVHEVEAINPDFIVVESAAQRHGMALDPKAAPMSYMTALAWAAMTRTGDYSGSLSEFKARDCRNLEVVKDADDETDDVPPTTEGRGTASPSSSPATTAAAPATGSTNPTTG